MWRGLKNQWSPGSVALAWFLAGHGSGWIYIATLFTNLKNFPPVQRGFVVGVMACFFGTSSAVWVLILNGCVGGHYENSTNLLPQLPADTQKMICVDGGLGGDVVAYMAVLAITIPTVVLISTLVTRHIVVEEDSHAGEERRFAGILGLTLMLIVFICTSNFFALEMDLSIRKDPPYTWQP